MYTKIFLFLQKSRLESIYLELIMIVYTVLLDVKYSFEHRDVSFISRWLTALPWLQYDVRR